MAKGKKIAITAAVFTAIIAAICLIYLNDNYKADTEAISALGYKDITVKDDGNVMVFTPDGEPEAGFIFYPGGKVEHRAYAGLMMALCDKGIMCIVPEMPFDLAVFKEDAAEGLADDYPDVENWYIGGHSLGGAMAANYLAAHTSDFEGLILLASYSTADLSKSKLDVLSLYGSEDWVLNSEKYIEYWDNLPENTIEYIIKGGNHAYFGTYGEQNGDGPAAITNKAQIEQAAKKISDFIK